MSPGSATAGPRRGWLFTVVQASLPAVLAGSILLTLLVAGATSLVRPIYSATTVLTLDGELAKVLKGVSDSLPSQTATDYIRNEYFATHSLNLMRSPAIASRLIANRNLRARGGGALYEGYLVNPGLVTLVYTNGGRGIFLNWIADTQQFSIQGLSPDPDEAVALAREYTSIFLDQTIAQYAEVSATLAKRFSSRIATVDGSIAETNGAIRKLQERYASVDIAEEAVQISHRIEELRQDLDDDVYAASTYAARLAEAEKQAGEFQDLMTVELSFEANPRISSLKVELQRLLQQKVAAVDFTDEHPEVVALQKQIDSVREAFKIEVDKTLQSEVKRRPTIAESLWQAVLTLRTEHLLSSYRIEFYTQLRERYLERQRELTAAGLELTPLKKKLDSLTALNSQTLTDLMTVQSLSDHTLPFYRVVSPATINTATLKNFKYFPRRRPLALGALAGSFFMLGFLSVARELYRNRFFGVWQFEETSGAPRVVDGGSMPPLADAAEAVRYRYVRTACIALRDDPLVSVSSLTPGEGRQAVARVLAWSHAEAGRSVLLVDADAVHRPLTRALGMEGLPGVQGVLSQGLALENCVVRDALPGVAVLPSGSGSPHGRDFALLIEQARRSWERVVVVVPPEAEHAALADLLPPHRRLVAAAWGHHEIEAVERLLGHGAEEQPPPVLVVTLAPAQLDLTTFRGLFGLACQTAVAVVPWRGRPRA